MHHLLILKTALERKLKKIVKLQEVTNMIKPCNLGIIVVKRVGESIADVYYEYESTVELEGKGFIADPKRGELRQKLSMDRVARKEALDG